MIGNGIILLKAKGQSDLSENLNRKTSNCSCHEVLYSPDKILQKFYQGIEVALNPLLK